MIEKKAKPATKTMAPAKAGSAVANKPNTAKAGVAATKAKPAMEKTAMKKPVAKETVVAAAAQGKNKALAVKEAATTAFEKKASAMKLAGANAMPTETQKTMAKPTLEERYRMVETAAYFISEQHCFQGRSDEHWAAAERQLGL